MFYNRNESISVSKDARYNNLRNQRRTKYYYMQNVFYDYLRNHITIINTIYINKLNNILYIFR